MKSELRTITPNEAKALLSKNTLNRKLNNSIIDEYAGYMKRGEWRITHQAIGIANTGKVLDGQHRLTAIIKANRSIKMYITTGLEENVMSVIDTGKKRTVNDSFQILGVKNTNNLTAAITKYLIVKNNNSKNVLASFNRGSSKLSYNEYYHFYLDNEHIINKFIKMAQTCYSAARFYTISEIAGISLFLNLDLNHSYSKIETFWLNVHMVKNDNIPACRVLYSTLLKYITGSEKIKPIYRSAITIKAWNFYINSANIKLLKFSTSEDMPEFI